MATLLNNVALKKHYEKQLCNYMARQLDKQLYWKEASVRVHVFTGAYILLHIDFTETLNNKLLPKACE